MLFELNHTGTPVLETGRLILRPFTAKDAGAMFRNWASDPEVTRYLTWPTHTGVDVSRKIIDMWVPEYEKPETYHWGIELKEKGELIGDIAIVQYFEYIGCGELGWCIGREWWGQGIMPEAGQAVLTHLFDTVHFNRIDARHDAANGKSGRVMQKLGMRYEGTNRMAGVNNTGLVDLCRYAILRSDWEEMKKG